MPTRPTPHRHLLVTTTRAAWLVDLDARRARIIDQGRGVYYGITFTQDRVFIACRQAEVGADRESQNNAILCLDNGLRPVEILHADPPLRDVHQIVCRGDTLLACSTYDDAVLRFSFSGRTWSAWYPFGRSGAADTHHINSVGLDGDAVLLAGNKPSGWFARLAEGHTSPDGRTPLGIGTHNVWVDESGAVAVCSSDEGAVRLADGTRRDLAERGWLRGFARDGRHAYVGVSQNRVRGKRDRSDCMILQLDHAGSVVETYAFLGFGMLHDMRVVGMADTSHNGVSLLLADHALRMSNTDYTLSGRPIDLRQRSWAERQIRRCAMKARELLDP